MKRCFDLLVSSVGLLFLSPILLVLALLVTTASPGGPFFSQTRIGRDRRPFKILKFRSMTIKAGSELGGFDAGDSARTTSLGRFLRRTKLDELPQLWNVLIGHMSLVGPRPEVPEWTLVHPERWERILVVRPGLTDPGSILFRDEERLLAESEDPERTYREEILPRKLELAEEYVAHRTFSGDLAILVLTARKILKPGTGTNRWDARESDR